jgi:hypothetical protein
MKGLKVQCPSCKRIKFETTERFNPQELPNGAMVKSLYPYIIDWLTSPTTLCAEMTCPECLAPLAPSGVLNVLVPLNMVGAVYERLFPKGFSVNDLLISELSVPNNGELPSDGKIIDVEKFDPPITLEDVDSITLQVNGMQVPIRDGSLQATVEGDILTVTDPKNFQIKEPEKHICPICGKEAKTVLGLNSHMRSHKDEKERTEETKGDGTAN